MDPQPPSISQVHTSSQPGPGSISTSAAGATHVPLYMIRKVKVYPIQENELTTLGLLTHIVTGAVAVASGVFGFIASIWWDMATSSDENTRHVGGAVTVVCVVVIVACVLLAAVTRSKRKTELRKILDESRLITSE